VNDDNIFGQGGEALTGKNPVQLFIKGDDPTGRGLAEAKQHLGKFLTNLRNSTLQQSQYRAQLSVGGEVLISHISGVTRVNLVLDPTTIQNEEAFYGGILIEPTVITNEVAYLTTAVAPTRAALLAAATSGKTTTQSGRPEVPGTGGLDTDQLIVWIHPKKPLTGSPVAEGAVKIYRIRAPEAGDIYDPDTTLQYSVSTIAPGTNFFVCGKRMQFVPALPTAVSGRTTGSDAKIHSDLFAVSLHAVKLAVPSFKTAQLTEATLVFAASSPTVPTEPYRPWVHRLYVIDTTTRTSPSSLASWQLLSEITTADSFLPNMFGTEFSETRVGTSTVFRCRGTNGAGACSEWEVTRAANGVFGGSLSIANSGNVEQVNQTSSSTFTANYWSSSTLDVDPILFTYPMYSEAVDTDGDDLSYTGQGLYNRYLAYKATEFGETHNYSFDIFGGNPGSLMDLFRGGAMPRAPYAEIHYVGSGATSCSFSSFEYRLRGTGLVGGSLTQAILDYQSFLVSVSGTGLTYAFSEYSPDPLYLGTTEFRDFYGVDMVHTFGEVYQFTFEYSAVYDPYNGGLSSTNPPTILPLYSVPGYYQYNLNSDLSDPDPDFEKYPYTHLPDLSTLSAETSTRIYDTQPICLFPKKAAIFDCDETWDSDVTVSGGGLFDGTFTATASRVGQTRADEYLANMWPTNVGAFPALDDAAYARTEVGDTYAAAAGTFADLPYEKFGYTAIDPLSNKLAWQAEQKRSGSWTYTPPVPMEGKTIALGDRGVYREHGDARTVTMKLLRPDGTVLMTIDDMLALFPRVPLGGYSADAPPVTIDINTVGRRQWPLRYNNPEHPEFDSDDIAKFPFTVTPFSSTLWTTPLFGIVHNHYPTLTTAYWGRQVDGSDVTPLYPEPKNATVNSNSVSDVQSTQAATRAITPGVFSAGIVSGSFFHFPNVSLVSTKMVGDLIYYDPRTGGFLTTLHWRDTDSQSVIETYIGNASGMVPFKQVLDEWIALGQVPVQSFNKILLSTAFLDTSIPFGRPTSTRLI
jgi:hypothetical protein